MVSATLERTFLPDTTEIPEQIGRGVQAGAKLVLGDGTEIELPAQLAEILSVAARTLQAGRAVTVAPTDTTLTTQQAADMLGVSRPTLVAMLERGEIRYTQPGRHRRIRLGDLLDYREYLRERQSAALDEMARISQEAGLDDVEHHRRVIRR